MPALTSSRFKISLGISGIAAHAAADRRVRLPEPRVCEVHVCLVIMAGCVLVSFNCAKVLQPENVARDIVQNALKAFPGKPDFVVLALQEVASTLSASLYALDRWTAPFLASVPKDWPLVAEEHVGAVVLLVFSPLNVHAVRKKSVPFGLAWSSVKGAALISLVFGENEQISFIGAHLAANEGKVADRNRDFATLVAQFGVSSIPGQIFVLGDLNYRALDGSFESDELSREMKAGNTAVGFSEAPVHFKPTYKFILGSEDYDINRQPSWCDRILFRDLPDVKVHEYNSHIQRTSDHRPVFLAITSPTKASSSNAPSTGLGVLPPPRWVSQGVDTMIGTSLFLLTKRGLATLIGLVVLIYIGSYG